MAERRPLAVIDGQIAEIPTGDSLPDELIPTSGGLSKILSTVTGINGKTVADTVVYTVPAGKKTIPQRMVIRLTAISGTGTVPKISVGTNSPNFDNIFGNSSLSGLTAVNDGFVFVIDGTFHVAQAAEVINIRVNNASTYTTYTFSVDLIGYEV